ncbi:putative cytochrome P450 [Nemania abortiva]|nr:putative cytochrome P450 [Nemania abortiva]
MSYVNESLSLAQLAILGVALGILVTTGKIFYNVFVHPLRNFPGPVTHGMSVVPKAVYQMNGSLPFRVAELHGRYGPVVRVAPNELAFSSPRAWRDIYGHKKEEFPKHGSFYGIFKHLPSSIINAGAAEHSMLRRQVAVGFSDRAMHEQESIIGSYVDLLISRLMEASQKDPCQNMREWYTWTTFDLIGDLSFGVDGGFGCLQNSSYHPWVKLIHESIRQQGIMLGLIALGFKRPITWLHKTATGLFADSKHRLIVKEKVAQRLRGGHRPDFLEGLVSNREDLGLSEGQIATNASVLILAGSETTATLLCAITYYLTTHLEILDKLKTEVRSAFASDREITLTSVGNLSFMLACLNEALRCHPPVMNGAPRYAPQDVIIDGKFVPKDAVLTIYQYAVNHDEQYWREPWRFAPERWLNDPAFKEDQRDAMQPFGTGPRDCVGRNLAYAEMRLILAKLVYNFDVSISEDSRDWLHGQKAYAVWHKPDLNVHLKSVAL